MQEGLKELICESMNELMNDWMNELMNESMNGQKESLKSERFVRECLVYILLTISDPRMSWRS